MLAAAAVLEQLDPIRLFDDRAGIQRGSLLGTIHINTASQITRPIIIGNCGWIASFVRSFRQNLPQ